jgi:hypothetical protein
MTKSLLPALLLGIGMAASAQNAEMPFATPPVKTIVENAPASTRLEMPSNHKRTSASGITVSNIGGSGNAYSVAFGPKTFLWADPQINAITLSHRALANHGNISYGLSKNGGTTWATNIGPVYTTTGTTNARYPQGLIYNPQNNTNPDNAYFAYYAPVLDGSNQNWGGHAFGVHKLSGSSAPTSTNISSNNEFSYVLPSGFFVTQQGVAYAVDMDRKWDGADYIYSDSIIIAKGVFNPGTGDYVYTRKKVFVPATIDGSERLQDPQIVFGKDGQTGYLVMLAHNDFNFQPTTAYYPVIYKTTDGGNTFTGPTNVNLSNIASTEFDETNDYTTGFELDAVVDGNNNLHLVLAVGPASTSSPWAISLPAQGWGIMDIYTTDQGTTWAGKILERPNSFRGCFGDCPSGTNRLNEDNRAQASVTYDGSKVFFTWFDTREELGTDNVSPDAFSIGYDINTKLWTDVKNLTKDTPADAFVTFGNVSYYVLQTPGKYNIPISYQELSNNEVLSPVTHMYIHNAGFTAADFGELSVNEVTKNSSFSVSQNQPNPFRGISTVYVSVEKPGIAKLEVFNTIGQSVSKRAEALNAGNNTFSIDATNLEAGIYFYSITINGESITKKMVIK